MWAQPDTRCRTVLSAIGKQAAQGPVLVHRMQGPVPLNSVDAYRFIVGSSATLKDSPKVLNASAVSNMARPGGYICAGAISIFW